MKPSLSAIHGRGRGTWQLEAQIEVHAGLCLNWFLGKGRWDLVQGIRSVSVHHHYGQSEFFLLVQRMAVWRISLLVTVMVCWTLARPFTSMWLSSAKHFAWFSRTYFIQGVWQIGRID
jgi:hypothetical protein